LSEAASILYQDHSDWTNIFAGGSADSNRTAFGCLHLADLLQRSVPFAEGRPLGSALYFMVTPGSPVRLHRIRNDQLYHYYLGDPIEVFLLHADGTTERIIVGPDLRSSQRVQLLIPGNTFHTARLIGAGAHRWFLGASTEWPGVVPADVEVGNLDEVAGKYPAVAADLRAIAASVQHVAPTGHFTETRASLSLSPSA